MAKKRKKILLFDDDFESMNDLKAFLEKELDWKVELSAEESLLDRLGRERFDLIIVDSMIHSQGIDAEKHRVQNIHYEGVNWQCTGLEFVRRFRRGEYSHKERGTPPTVPLIILSAVANSAADGEWGKVIQNEHQVEKPFRLSDLVHLMRALVWE